MAQSELSELGGGGLWPFLILVDQLNIFKPQGQINKL